MASSGDQLRDGTNSLRLGRSCRRVYADIGAAMRYILLFLRPTQELIDALTESFSCQNPDIARRWCEDLLASAWRIWTATQSEAPS